MASCGEVDHSVDTLSSGKKVAGDASSSSSGNGANGPSSPSPSLPPVPECAICLQSCVHPVRLPCRHVFCFLCAKGASWHSRRCALCRQEVPEDFLERPALLSPEELKKAASGGGGGGRGGGAGSDEHAWYYEGRNGWWQYDERTSRELEDAYARGKKSAEMLIAGFLYVADLENMVQYRRNEHGRRRRMKRDAVDVPKKGVAGLRIEPETLATTATAQGASVDDGERESSADGADARSQPVFAAPPVRPPTSLGAHPVAPVTASVSPTATTSGPDAVVQQFSQLSIGAGPRGAESNEEEEEEEDEDEDSVAPDASGYESESGTDDDDDEEEVEEEEDGGVRRAERERDRNRTRETATVTMTDRLSPGDEGEEGGAGVRSRSPDGQCTVTEV